MMNIKLVSLAILFVKAVTDSVQTGCGEGRLLWIHHIYLYLVF